MVEKHQNKRAFQGDMIVIRLMRSIAELEAQHVNF